MSDNLELLPFFGFIIIACVSFYVCCKKIKLLQNEIIRENIEPEIEEIIINENEITNDNTSLTLPPPYKLRDDPPIYTDT
jgi:hypothetical protein